MKKSLFCSVLLSSSFATHAFPDMIRHGYTSCSACHFSNSGGGILTDYGRELSGEVLSHDTSGLKESSFAMGSIPLPSWLLAQSSIRGLYYVRDTPNFIEGRFIPMQADLQAAAYIGDKLSASASVGPQVLLRGQRREWSVVSREHFLSYQISDSFQAKLGRFTPDYGIKIPEHTQVTRGGLGFGQGQESYNAELSYESEKHRVVLTGIAGRPENSDLNAEKGAALNVARYLLERAKVGFNFLYGEKTQKQRHLYGFYGVIGLTPRLYLLSEIDWQQEKQHGLWTKGPVIYNKLGWELLKGFQLFGSQEFSQLDHKNSSSRNITYASGIHYFPRPHYQIDLSARAQKRPILDSSYWFTLWLALNVYI